MSETSETKTYTLDEAQRELAVRECGFRGHDWDIVTTALGTPTRLLCGRCGESRVVASRPPEGDWRTVNACGRVVTLEVGEMIDDCDQFRVALSIDGKTTWEGWITNKSDRLSGDPVEPGSPDV